MIKAVFFDLGGVILHQDAMSRRAWEIFRPSDADSFWERYNVEALPFCRGEIGRREFWQRLSERLGYPVSQNLLDQLCAERFQDNRSADEEVVAIIKSLRGRCRLGLISNISEEFAAVVRKMGIFELFDDVVLSYQVRLTKDRPEIFRLALARLGVEATESVFIDDFRKYVEVARSVGMRGIVFSGSATLKRQLAALSLV